MALFKEDAPAPPDYSSIAAANEKAADRYADIGQQQLDFYKQQYDEYKPYVLDYLQSTTDTSNENRTRAQEYYDTYTNTYLPIEKDYARTALDYNTPARTEARAGAAMADVANQYEAARNASLASLESYGIDPSQTRYGALDLSSRVAQAADMAAAGTKSRLGTEAIGLGLQGEAIKTGRGYAPNVSGAYDTATNAGKSGTGSATSLYGTSASAMGSPNSYFNSSNTALGNWTNTLNTSYGNELSETNLNNKNTSDTFNFFKDTATDIATLYGGFGGGAKK
jgi:hypothetical protein